MSKLIQIDKYFFECSQFTPNEEEIGKTERTFNGKPYTQTTSKHMIFELTIEGLSPSMHSNLLYILDKNRDYNNTAENLTLVDDVGNSYTVIIPANEYNYDREEGKGESYRWELTLEEV